MKNAWLTCAIALLLLVLAIFFFDRPGFLAVLDRFSRSERLPENQPKWADTSSIPEASQASVDPRLVALARKFMHKDAIPHEAVLTFANEAAYRAFLANHDPKLKVLDKLDALKGVRVRYEDLSDLLNAVGADIAPNYLVQLPSAPSTDGPGIQPDAVPFGRNPMSYLGINGDQSNWGAGKKIAILDTGIEPHPTFRPGQVVGTIDLVGREGAHAEIHGHGTAVGSVVGGGHSAAPGVAPAAGLLDVRVADESGNSDSFTLAKGIIEAADARANIINISLGSFGDSSAVKDAVAYAQEHGAVIVAAAGNNGAQELTYPAAYSGVISVGSVDANSQWLAFSNTSSQLSIAAPGYGVPAAWPGEKVIEFTGTSASAPFVAGSLAAVMSMEPNLSAAQAMQLLTTYANEAGAPGYDPQFGNGILDVGRVINRNQPGIIDAAVASHYYAGDVEGNGREILQVVVQNRGTQPIPSSSLKIVSPSGSQSFLLPALNPGQVVYRETAVDTRYAELNGAIQYGSNLTLPTGFKDIKESNNQLSSTFQLAPAADKP